MEYTKYKIKECYGKIMGVEPVKTQVKEIVKTLPIETKPNKLRSEFAKQVNLLVRMAGEKPSIPTPNKQLTPDSPEYNQFQKKLYSNVRNQTKNSYQ